MWTDFIAYRNKENVDQLTHTFKFDEFNKVIEHYPRGYYNTDRFGRPLFIDVSGNVKVDNLFTVTTTERFF